MRRRDCSPTARPPPPPRPGAGCSLLQLHLDLRRGVRLRAEKQWRVAEHDWKWRRSTDVLRVLRLPERVRESVVRGLLLPTVVASAALLSHQHVNQALLLPLRSRP
uniref:Uncharacterized protein n=1 Tax=Haptolina ericina TaxID=156174 RepID=A0A7S3EU31_9EUKA